MDIVYHQEKCGITWSTHFSRLCITGHRIKVVILQTCILQWSIKRLRYGYSTATSHAYVHKLIEREQDPIVQMIVFHSFIQWPIYLAVTASYISRSSSPVSFHPQLQHATNVIREGELGCTCNQTSKEDNWPTFSPVLGSKVGDSRGNSECSWKLHHLGRAPQTKTDETNRRKECWTRGIAYYKQCYTIVVVVVNEV